MLSHVITGLLFVSTFGVVGVQVAVAGSARAGAAPDAQTPPPAAQRDATSAPTPKTAPQKEGGADRPASASAATAAGERWKRLDEVILEDIKQKKLRGAVVLVGQRDKVLYRKAYGDRALEPTREPMTLDTIFDAASLTKVVATTTSVMILLQEGRIRLNDRVADYVPGFERYGKRNITIRHLLNHMSGLRPDIDWSYEWVGYDKAIELAIEEVPVAPPNDRFIYSDINFFLLGHIVGKVAGTGLADFTSDRIFKPLRMKDTMFLPPATLRPRIAPTEKCPQYDYPCNQTDAGSRADSGSAAVAASGGASGAASGTKAAIMLRGIVHDPTSRRMGGVAGHAGLFTTADDLAIFARMLLNAGATGGTRILSPLTVARMIAPSMPPNERNQRGLGWDIDSSFSANRGELLPIGSFGHTGFTGTSIWIDPLTGGYVIFMSSRLHPDGKGDVTPLRARVATVAAAALTDVPPLRGLKPVAGRDFAPTAPSASAADPLKPVMTGLDMLRAEGFARLKGKRVGLVTNHTGRASDGTTTIDLLAGSKDFKLVALFSPEHGIRGILDEKVPSSRDEKTGLTIHSLYGETRRPTAAMLEGIDTMVIDLQDIGARFYTYMNTMANVMEEAAARKIEVVVLDRPNPINGWAIEGPMLDKEVFSFVGSFPMPIRHGLTLGELAELFNAERKIGAKLTVIPMKGWTRDTWFDQTGLPWINPSPNMRNMIQASLYPGIGAIESTNISVGRGTDTPFEQIGAPWIDGVALSAALNARRLPGIQFYPVMFTPTSSKYAKEACQGVFMLVTDRAALRPVRVGLEIAAMLAKLHRAQYKIEPNDRLIGSRESVTRILAGDDPADVAAAWSAAEGRWRLLRTKYLLYR
jgi:uncharacterized protein YbbC (DUF1343 family)/CubicO group peptidase (beta-lactamase class C family)